MNIVGIAPGKRVHPVRGFREANQYSHKATFPQDKCVGGLSACDVTPGFLETATQACQLSIGTWPQWLRQVLKPMGSKGAGELLHGGHSTQQVWRKTAWFTLIDNGQELRLGFLNACCSLHAMSDLMTPAETYDPLCKCFVEHMPDGSQACSPFQQGCWMGGHAPFHRRRHPRQLLVQRHSWGLEGIRASVSPNRPTGQAIVRYSLGCCPGRVLRVPRESSDPTDLLVQLRLDMAVCCTSWLRHLWPIMILAHRMGHGGERVMYRETDRFWRLAEHAHQR